MACMVEFVLEDGLGWNWFMVEWKMVYAPVEGVYRVELRNG